MLTARLLHCPLRFLLQRGLDLDDKHAETTRTTPNDTTTAVVLLQGWEYEV